MKNALTDKYHVTGEDHGTHIVMTLTPKFPWKPLFKLLRYPFVFALGVGFMYLFFR